MSIWVFHLLHVLINRSHQSIKPGCELNRSIKPPTSRLLQYMYPLVLTLEDKSPLTDLSLPWTAYTVCGSYSQKFAFTPGAT
jgi:hypothetical protein